MKINLPTARANGRVAHRNGNGADSDLQVPALERGLAVLELLANSTEGLTLAELNESLKISSASLFRIAAVLENRGYVHRDDRSRRFTLTRKMLLLGQPHANGRSLAESCLDALRRVLAATGETTQLCCLAEEHCVIVEQLPSQHPSKYIVDLGSRAPVHCAAPGKAMLAFLPEAELAELLPRLKLEKHTGRSITNRKDLLAELETIRRQGYAVDHGEHFEGIHCVAAPLLDRHGHALAAITIAGPKERIPQTRFAEIGKIIRQAALEAAHRFVG